MKPDLLIIDSGLKALPNQSGETMNWKRFVISAMSGLMVLGLSTAVSGAAEGQGAEQTKTGTVKKVDMDAKQVVVMVSRELTFTVTDGRVSGIISKLEEQPLPASLDQN